MSPANQSTWTFGRSTNCDIVIEATAVSSQHGRISAAGANFVIEDLGSTNGVYVNGQRIDAATTITRNDQVTLGQHVSFPWQLVPAAPAQAPVQTPNANPAASPNPFGPKQAENKPLGGGGAISPFGGPSVHGHATPAGATPPAPDSQAPFASAGPNNAPKGSGGQAKTRTAFIGRDPSCDLVLNVPTVSWRHASLIRQDGRVVITDLGSANGIAIGGPSNAVSQSEIDPADTVYLGSHPISAVKLFQILDQVPGEDVVTPPQPFQPAVGESPFGGPALSPKVDSSEWAGLQATVESALPDLNGAKPPVSIPIGNTAIVLGRDPSCDQILNYPMISRFHAKITPNQNGLIVEDLSSRNGTYVNGRRIRQSQTVGPGDIVSLGSFSVTLESTDSNLALVARDMRGDLTIEARNVTVAVPGKRLLENVSLTIRPGEFVGLMGPSGAGKSTLMNALNGYTPPSDGAVFVDGKNLHQHYDLFRGQIGYVPQDDIMHRNLTVRQALYYTARLRFPPDFSDSEIERRIEEVSEQLGLRGTEDVLIGSPEKKGISGGQRKRVNLAMELLTDPSILFLDEPTSGLSSEDAVMVMKLLRDLADRGKTILLTIHQPSLEAYRLMDHLVMISKDASSPEPGRLAYFGPAYPDAVNFFNPDGVPGLVHGAEPSPDEILRGLSKRPSQHWTDTYQRSSYRQEFVTNRQGRVETMRVSMRPTRRREAGVLQAWTLFRRNLRLKLADKSNTALLLLQAPIIAALIALVFGSEASQEIEQDTWGKVAKATATTLFLLALSSLWCGCSNAVREIVGEWAIYRRERMVNLKIPSYIASKLAVLFGLSGIQTFLLLTITYFANGLEGSWLLMFFILMLASTLGVAIGLFVSSLAPSSEFAVAMLPIVILPMVMLGGVLQPIPEMGFAGRAVTYVTPSRWSFEAVLLVEASKKENWDPDWAPDIPTLGSDEDDSNSDEPKDIAETFFPVGEHRSGIPICLFVLGVMLTITITVVALILRRRDIH